MGLVGYCRHFILYYAIIVVPLMDLLKKDNFHWTSQVADAFSRLQQLLASAPVLQLPNFAKPFVLKMDASRVGIGAILSQDHHLIAYSSQKLTHRTQFASTFQPEMFAIT